MSAVKTPYASRPGFPRASLLIVGLLAFGCDSADTGTTFAVQQTGGIPAAPAPGPGIPDPAGTGGFVAPVGGMDVVVPEMPVGGGAPLDGAPGAGTDATNAFCEVLDVAQRNCAACHGSTLVGGAPMPLVTYADFQAAALSDSSKKVFELIPDRIHATMRPMPPVPTVMSDEDKATLDAWVAAGALAPADPTCPDLVVEPTGEGHEAWPAQCNETNTYKLLASASGNPSQPYMVPGNSETHPGFVFDAPWGDTPVQMVAYRPIVGDGNVAHHWILYSNGGLGGGQNLISWSPGKDEDPGLPDNVGIFFPSGRQSLRLDMHYYNKNNPNSVPDQTGLEVCVTTEFKEFSATVYSLTASATVPANSKVDNKATCTVNVAPGADAHLISAAPHMHGLGVNGKLELTRDGVTTVLIDKPFDFDDQTIYTLDNFPVKTGDRLTTTCSYQNDTSRTVYFGENTSNEMCFNFMLYYPKDQFSCR